MKHLLAGIALVAVTSVLSGCYVAPDYSYVRGNGYGGDAYYGSGPAVVYNGYYAPGLYGYGYGGYGYGLYGCCYAPGIYGYWYGGRYYRGRGGYYHGGYGGGWHPGAAVHSYHGGGHYTH